MTTTICGVNEDLEKSSNSSLDNLRKEIGRNGDTKLGIQIGKKIDKILKDREKAGVTIQDKGKMHHPV